VGAPRFDSGWQEADGTLRRELRFADFGEAFAFMTRVAILAERHDHHPDWSNSWNRVTIVLTTHDAGSVVTERDRLLAAAIDEILT
jgi:4a-hydroxytetrahydrobiopterin dehydratase